MNLTDQMFAERQQGLERQMGEAQSRLLKLKAAAEKARNDVEAIRGAMQECAAWRARLNAPQPETNSRVTEAVSTES